MRHFLIKLTTFSLAVYVLLWIADYYVCSGLLNMEDYRFQDYSSMLEGGMENDVVIMGNSRGKSHFDTRIIDSLCDVSSFSIGIGGYPLNVQLAKLKLYLEHNDKPKVIIQNVDYVTFGLMDDVRHQHQSEQFFPLIYDRAMRRELRRLGYGFLDLYVPMYRMYGYQMVIKNGLLEASHLKHYVSRPAYKGFRPEDGPWDGEGLAEMKKTKVSVPQKGKELMNEYLSFCRDNNIGVILVNSPMYYGAIEKLDGYEDVQEYFRDLSRIFDIPFLDYTENCAISRDTANFCVSVHMNPQATKEFTELLCGDIDL